MVSDPSYRNNLATPNDVELWDTLTKRQRVTGHQGPISKILKGQVSYDSRTEVSRLEYYKENKQTFAKLVDEIDFIIAKLYPKKYFTLIDEKIKFNIKEVILDDIIQEQESFESCQFTVYNPQEGKSLIGKELYALKTLLNSFDDYIIPYELNCNHRVFNTLILKEMYKNRDEK